MQLERVPVLWDVIYPVHPDAPIGRIRRELGGFHAWLGEEDLGVHPNGDAAAEVVWRRLVEASAVRHAGAAITHGGRDRHR